MTASLDLVLQQATQRQDSVAKKVRAASLFVEQEIQQTQNLTNYLGEYQEKIRLQKHCSAIESIRYRSFCAQLQTAIVQQQEKVQFAEARLAELRQELVEQQHKISVLQDMIEKKHQNSAAVDEKKLQKLIDELSARQHIRSMTT
ncbi:flagellar export protein FliJ [Eionea flava]